MTTPTYKKIKQHSDGHAVMCTVCGMPVLNQVIHDRFHADLLAAFDRKENRPLSGSRKA